MNNSYQSRNRGGRRSSSSSKRSTAGSRKRSGFHGRSRGNHRGRKSQASSINQSKFINKNPTVQTAETYTAKHSFKDFAFSEDLLENLEKKGYEMPTRIQDETIPLVLSGRDVVGLANTGSGKTAAFILPIIQRLVDQNDRKPALVITPTRELAQQIQVEFKQFAYDMRLYSTVCVGGLPIRRQINELRRGQHVIIGTPGRLKDLIEQNVLRLDDVSVLVLDEADRMLDMGFLPDITRIIKELPKERQSLCFSATTTPQINALFQKLLVDPVTVSVRTSETGEHIAQDIIRAKTQDEKMDELLKMLSQDNFEKVLIFGNMKHSVQRLADTLTKKGFPSIAIHGNKTQPQRSRALKAFKQGDVNIMVATDVAARGLDVPDVSHVINFDQPQTHEEYVHRIGRTGRANKTGQAYTFV
jgi:ATP-dependent RNA helicase RhlE